MKKSSFNKEPLILALMVMATGQMAASIIFPSLPMISTDLSVEPEQSQKLVSLFLIGFGLSQLFLGPFSDLRGRRTTFILGQSIFLIGAIVSYVSVSNVDAMAFGRLIQGVGAGSCSVLGKSIIRDKYEGADLSKALSYLVVISSIVPIISPVLGGWLTIHLGWQSVFALITLYVAVTLGFAWFAFPETLPHAKKKFEIARVLKAYSLIARNFQVFSNASYNWLTYLGSIVTLTIFPFLLQKDLGLTASEYGEVVIIPSLGLLMGSGIASMLNGKVSTFSTLILAICILLLSGVWFLFAEMTVINTLGGFTGFAVAQGILLPVSMTMLLMPYKDKAGLVSAYAGAIQMLFAGIIGGGLANVWVKTQADLGMMYCCLAVILFFMTTMKQFKLKKSRI
ncbi:multidrug effflux MFS transporter [Vibrio sp. CyArs1]|uniref:multidrug effflux MFS transporter n=1 Tax=Vibrio sp. CyArs1 TaxID=2682577 RepID=UPI001F06ABF8|nr:multidrug effflux MFS transporter [Vibrio sp. CyArs1]